MKRLEWIRLKTKGKGKMMSIRKSSSTGSGVCGGGEGQGKCCRRKVTLIGILLLNETHGFERNLLPILEASFQNGAKIFNPI